MDAVLDEPSHPREHMKVQSSFAHPALDRRTLLVSLGGAAAAAFVPAIASAGPASRRQSVIVIGAGIAGLVAAHEIERRGGTAILLEARDRVGGRAWTLRRGDRIAHLGDADAQTVGFSEGLYLNAGPARIPSHHDQYLGLTRTFDVPVEVLVNGSRSDYLFDGRQQGPAGRMRVRQAAADLRGQLSALLDKALRGGALDQQLDAGLRARLVTFLKAYGDLAADGTYQGSQRAGLSQVPGATIEQAIALPPLTLDALLANTQLAGLLFEENVLMQPTMLQPVGGMDRLPVAMARALRTPVRLDTEVREIRRDGTGVRVVFRHARSGQFGSVAADRAIITTPLPILARTPNDFSPAVRQAIAAVRYSDSIKIGFESTPFWEAEQIYGGISYVGGDTGVVWYPSGQFQQRRQILLAAYAAREQAQHLAAHTRAEQIAIARAAVDGLHPGHGRDLVNPALIHWERVPFSEGPWVEWEDQGNDPRSAAVLNAGDGPFLFAGSHLSAYSGHWQEGAILSARRAVGLLPQTA